MDKVCSKQNRAEENAKDRDHKTIFSRAGPGWGKSLGDLVLLAHASCYDLHIKHSRKFKELSAPSSS